MLLDSKLFSGMLMILMNMGSKHIMAELTPVQDKMLASIAVKRIVLFAIFFMATRDFVCSLALTIICTVFLSFLLNEHSAYYLFQDPPSSP